MRNTRLFSLLLLVLDTITTLLVFNAGARLRGMNFGDAYLEAVVLLPLSFLVLALYLIDGYKPRTNMLRAVYASQHCIAVLAALVGTLLLTYVAISSDFPLQTSRSVVAGSFLCIALLSLAYRRALQFRLSGGKNEKPLIFIGEPAAWNDFKENCRAQKIGDALLFCDISNLRRQENPDDEAHASTQPVQLLTAIMDGRIKAEAIVLTDDGRPLPMPISSRMVKCYFRGTPAYTLELFIQVYWRKVPLDRINHAWLLREGFRMAREPVWLHSKRLLDIFAAGVGLLISAPFLLTACLAIYLDDRGPVLFRQTRIGKDNKPFTLFKLRTMRNNQPKGDAGLYTQEKDPRITRTGRFLRSSRLDEVPQLLNVLRGEMSLIGPRAEWDLLVAKYEKEIPCYAFRHLVKPGITGWAQVNYPYGAGVEDARHKLEYDLYYIRHYSFLLDASITLKTIHVMLFGEGR